MTELPVDHADRAARAHTSLAGLSVGDAFGETYFGPPAAASAAIAARRLAPTPWPWTDDTAMALSVVEVLEAHGTIDREALARAFARRYDEDGSRAYGRAAHEVLWALTEGSPWPEAARRIYDGIGSLGNGGAMRSAPVGAYFADDLQRVVDEARRSAEPTHAHPDGQAGAIAVAVAAALAVRGERDAAGVLRAVWDLTPAGATRDGLGVARELGEVTPQEAARVLGSGRNVTSADTVPFSLWCAAHHLDDFEEALWTTVAGLGDRDTTCAIVGGVVACAVGVEGIPPAWVAAREPLPALTPSAGTTWRPRTPTAWWPGRDD